MNDNNNSIDRPPLCCIDIDSESKELLIKKGYSITDGSLGPIINIKRDSYGSDVKIHYKNMLPYNLHEHDIIILDLENKLQGEFNQGDFTTTKQADNNKTYFISSRPATIFDFRPLSIFHMQSILDNSVPRTIIIFTSKKYDIEYQSSTTFFERYKNTGTLSNYPFISHYYISDSREGRAVQLASDSPLIASMFKKFIGNIYYNQTFHTTDNNKKDYIQPLLKNKNGDNISVVQKKGKDLILFVPQIDNKGEFLLNFLENVAPQLRPELFPNMTNSHWLKNKMYYVPKHEELLIKKELLEQEYKEKLKEIDNKIAINSISYSFLHTMITESGNTLVEAVITFLKWLKFEEVLNADEGKENEDNEEDIFLKYKESQILIECKGIGGTSKDKECSQIDKIVQRRMKKQKSTSISGLYIVNHQRQRPPLERDNPPFKPHQVKDATYMERGMLSTWQLFNLYFDIQNNLISKQAAREGFLKSGLVEFDYDKIISIGTIAKYYKDHNVYSIELTGEIFTKNDILCFYDGHRYRTCNIDSMQQDKKPVDSASEGRVGIKFSSSDLTDLKEGTEMFKLLGD